MCGMTCFWFCDGLSWLLQYPIAFERAQEEFKDFCMVIRCPIFFSFLSLNFSHFIIIDLGTPDYISPQPLY